VRKEMKKRKQNETTNRHIRDMLPKVLEQIGALHRDRPDLIVSAWSEVIGEKLAPMTKAVAFENGILTVKVNNSTLYSLLSQHERGRLLACLRKRFSTVEIKNIYFKIG
jgi:predicted nucleic acid-binding Zn ribbon protein